MAKTTILPCGVAGKVAAGICGDLSILVGGRTPWSDAEYLAVLDALVAHEKVNGPCSVNLLFASAQATTQSQRLKLTEYTSSGRLTESKRVAILSESALIRSVGNASRVLFRRISFQLFAPTRWTDAFDWLGELSHFDPVDAKALLVALLAQAGYGPEVLKSSWRSRSLVGK